METIKTKAFFMDANNNNSGFVFGRNYVGISFAHGTIDDGREAQAITFCELQEPFDTKHPEKAIPRDEIPTITLAFCTKESIDGLIENLQYLRSKFLKGPAILDAKLDEQDFSLRTLNVLRCAELVTVRDLVRYKRTDLLKFRNFGKVSLRDIDEWLAKHDLHFDMDV